MASFRLSHRPLRACSFAKASPKLKNPRSERPHYFLNRSSGNPASAPQPLSTPATIADEALIVAGAAAPFIPNPLAQAIIILAAQFGPQIIGQIDAVLNKTHIQMSDIQGIFAGLQPYSAFGIPDVAPKPPGP